VSHAWLPNKSSAEVAEFVVKAVRDTGRRPYTIWSDNGGEFAGRLDDILPQLHIKHNRTKPYNPQQNGKMERFWATVDKAENQEQGDQVIDWYNRTPKKWLAERVEGRRSISPNELCRILPRWDMSNRTWRVDGVTMVFDWIWVNSKHSLGWFGELGTHAGDDTTFWARSKIGIVSS
jgi:transposase InsO family protein